MTYEMFKNLDNDTLLHFLEIFNKSWILGEVPDAWRHSIVVPIPKPGKEPSSPHSYRPIALTSHACKIMESMIAARLKWFLEKHRIINPFQSGFRSNRSTQGNIIAFHNEVYKNISDKRTVVSVFMDIERAYDIVWREVS